MIIATMLTVASACVSHATDEALWTTVTTPDSLVVFDLSGSMAQNPSGGSNIWSDSSCTPNSACNSTSGSNYGYRSSSSSTCNTRCAKIDIAKYALFTLLNDSNSDTLNEINSADMSSLGIRLGLMRYYDCGSSSQSAKSYTDTTGCIKLSWPITADAQTTTTPYANLFCNNSTCSAPSRTSSNSCSSPGAVSGAECMVGYGTSGGTPLGYSLREAKSYLDAHKALDDSRTCRQKSVIIVTDGADTYTCNGDGSSTGTSQRRAPVYYAKQLAAAGYKVYVVGFGTTMSSTDQNVLNWMAYFGGTRNPNTTQSGNTSRVSVGTNPCSNGTDPGSYTLNGYAFMASSPADLSSALRAAITSIQEANYSFSSQASVAAARVQEENFIYEASFEPKNNTGANKEPFWVGHLKKYSLNSTTGELITPPNWDAGAKLRDTAASARHMWTYKGATANALASFDTTNIKDADLGVGTSTSSCGTSCTSVVGFYRGDATYNLESWKLGDLFHTNPVAVRTPTPYFYDPRDCGGTSFNTFRSATDNIRTSANGKQLILAGANDGQLHAFRTGNSATDATAGGDEVWSFIPPNLLQKISPIAHNSHTSRSSLSSHDYFVDGPIQISDIWIPSTASSGISKNSTDWKTLAVFGEGQGSGNYLWSSSSTCYSNSTSGFSATYSTTYPYYCGLYALDVTNTLSANQPIYLWKLNPTTAQAPFLAESWSKMQIGRVKIAGNEKWVGFIGGGYSGTSCLSADGATSTACNTPATGSPGKGFFVVDLINGNILWSFTHGTTAAATTNPNMDFSAPGSPLPLDLDSDGFIDTVYMGDLGGNMWRFRLCARDSYCSSCGLGSYTNSPCTSCTTTSWTGSLLYSATNTERGYGLSTPSNTHKQIFTTATATKDHLGNVWVYFGTGENNDPTWKPPTTPTAIPDTSDTKNRLFGIKEDSNFTATYTTTNLTNITSTSTVYDGTATATHGWYINLSTNTLTRSDGTTIASPVGEKMISDPTVFGGVVYFSTYVPDQGTASACGLSGDAFLYGIKYLSGAGALESDSRTKYIGHGIGSSPIISMRPGSSSADIYATASGGAGTAALTQKLGETPTTSSMTNILYWKDRRLQ
jgi:Tfp pilus tip-associated adhesin PilY1